MHRQTLQFMQKVLGPEHPDTLKSMNNLGFALYRQGKFVEVEQMRTPDARLPPLSSRILEP
jgi:hypothetical protein